MVDLQIARTALKTIPASGPHHPAITTAKDQSRFNMNVGSVSTPQPKKTFFMHRHVQWWLDFKKPAA